jgi:hypothetical protein
MGAIRVIYSRLSQSKVALEITQVFLLKCSAMLCNLLSVLLFAQLLSGACVSSLNVGRSKVWFPTGSALMYATWLGEQGSAAKNLAPSGAQTSTANATERQNDIISTISRLTDYEYPSPCRSVTQSATSSASSS